MDNGGALALLKTKPQFFLTSNIIIERVPPSAERKEESCALDKKEEGNFCTMWSLASGSQKGMLSPNMTAFAGHTIPVEYFSAVDKNNIRGYTLPTDGAAIAITTQLSGCSICWERTGNSLTLAHIQPDQGQAAGAMKTALEGGAFAGGIGSMNVFGVDQGDSFYDNKKEYCNVIGILIRGSWALFGQVTSGTSRDGRVYRVIPISVPW